MKEPAPAASDRGYDGQRAANGEHEQLLSRHPDREYGSPLETGCEDARLAGRPLAHGMRHAGGRHPSGPVARGGGPFPRCYLQYSSKVCFSQRHAARCGGTEYAWMCRDWQCSYSGRTDRGLFSRLAYSRWRRHRRLAPFHLSTELRVPAPMSLKLAKGVPDATASARRAASARRTLGRCRPCSCCGGDRRRVCGLHAQRRRHRRPS